MAESSPSARKRRGAKVSSSHVEFRDRLLAAVERLLDEGTGFGELGIGQIVAEAGTSRSTFYLHFRDKSQLLEESLRAVMDDLIAVAGLTWHLPPDAGREQVRQTMGTVVTAFAEHARLMVTVADIAGADGQVGSALTELMEHGRQNLAEHIRTGQADGSVRGGIDPETVAGLLVAMAERGLGRLTPGASAEQLEAVADSLTHVVWASLYEGTASRG